MQTPNSPPPTFPCPGSSLYYALNAVPATRRSAVHQWLRWWHETARIPLEVSDPGVAETKLRWWQQAVADAALGQAQHPLLHSLIQPHAVKAPATLPEWGLWQAQLGSLIELVHQNRWLDEATLHRHMAHSTAAACEGLACLLGTGTPAARQAARDMGCGLRMAHQLARLGQDARAGWVHVPIEVLQRHGVRAHQLSKPDAQQVPEGWPGLLAALHQQARQTLVQALQACRALPGDQARALRPLCVLGEIQLALIDQIATQGDRVLHERIVLTPLRKWWISQRVRWGW